MLLRMREGLDTAAIETTDRSALVFQISGKPQSQLPQQPTTVPSKAAEVPLKLPLDALGAVDIVGPRGGKWGGVVAGESI